MAQDTLEPELASTGLDDSRYEVVAGTVVEKPEMGSFEAFIASALASALRHHARVRQLGRACAELLFRLDPHEKRQRRPDVSFLSFERWPKGRRIPSVNALDVVPDLAVEVISPTNLAWGVQEKVAEYFEAGVRRVWVIYPTTRQVYDYASATQVRIWAGADSIDGGDVVPGFSMTLAELFEDGDGDD